MPKEKKGTDTYWRILLNLWTLVTFIAIVMDFYLDGSLSMVLDPVLLIYTAILAVYSAEKEFERWHLYYTKRHIGEIYVALWTLLLAGLSLAGYERGGGYHIDHELVATYIVVLGVLAITRKSRNLYFKKAKPE